MVNDPTNGGKRINKLETDNAVQDTMITLLVNQTREIHEMLTAALPQIIRHEECVKSNRDWIRALWAIAIALSVVAVKAAFF